MTSREPMEVAGVAFPASVEVAGRSLGRNGAGLRTRFFLKVYAIGLYLERPGTDAAAILATDAVRHVELHVLRSLSADDIGGAISDAFEQNAGAAAGRLRARLDRLKALLRPAEAGETIALTYLPGEGTLISANGQPLGTIEGKDFADVLLAVWIGASPVDSGLRKALLQGG